MDEAEKIARDGRRAFESDKAFDQWLASLMTAVQAYGEQCRRAGAEAMREVAAKVLENGSFLHDKSPSAIWAKQVAALIRALPSVAEAASPAAGWRTDLKEAPKDGSLVDLLSASRGRLIGCRWTTKTGKERHWWWPDPLGSARRITDATHWMLPPAFPAPSEEARAG